MSAPARPARQFSGNAFACWALQAHPLSLMDATDGQYQNLLKLPHSAFCQLACLHAVLQPMTPRLHAPLRPMRSL